MLEVIHRPQQGRLSSPSSSPSKDAWYLVSSHGALLFWIAANPGCTADQAAEALCLTPRTIWGLIGDLKRAEMLNVHKEGKRHHYTVNMAATFRHPVLSDYPVGLFLSSISPHQNGHRK